MHLKHSNDVLATTSFETIAATWVNCTIMPAVRKGYYGRGWAFYSYLVHNAAQVCGCAG